jgi:alcohol dehydrogenase class IV
MYDFLASGSFLSPSVIFGIDKIQEIGRVVKELECKKYLLITDPILDKVGITAKVIDCLREEKGKTILIPPHEPYIEDAEKVAEAARGDEYDVIIGVGGGSILDLAKMASMAANNPGPIEAYIGKNKVKNKGLPMILVPTTSGTGSEVTYASVLSKPDGIKVAVWDPKILANVAIVDPRLTVTMPPKITASSGLDALSHAIEALTNKLANPITDGLALESLKLIFRSLPKACAKGDDLTARYEMSLAALMAGLAFSNSMLNAGHAIAYTYSHKYNLPHGIACGLATPYVLRYNMPKVMDRVVMIAKAIGEDVEDPQEAGERVVRRIVELIKQIGMPSNLRDIGVKEEEISEFAGDLLNKYSRLLPNNPRDITYEDAVDILRDMWKGI